MYDLIARFAYLAYTYHADLVRVGVIKRSYAYPLYKIELFKVDKWVDSFGKEKNQTQLIQTVHRYC